VCILFASFVYYLKNEGGMKRHAYHKTKRNQKGYCSDFVARWLDSLIL
jgi:hypothetical protein